MRGNLNRTSFRSLKLVGIPGEGVCQGWFGGGVRLATDHLFANPCIFPTDYRKLVSLPNPKMLLLLLTLAEVMLIPTPSGPTPALNSIKQNDVLLFRGLKNPLFTGFQ